jgi:hypothetical protein
LQDIESDGKVNKKIFERIIHDTRTFLSREELGYLYRKYTDPINEDLVDYNRLSRDLNLHNGALGQNSPSQHSKILADLSAAHLRKSSQDYVGGFSHHKVMHKRAVTSLGGGGLLAKSHAQRFFARANNNFMPV